MSETIIRPLAQSEAFHAMAGLYNGQTTRVSGTLNVDALSAAISALAVAYPVLSGRIGVGAAGPALTEGSGAQFGFSRAEGYSDDRLFQLPDLDGRVGIAHVVEHDAATWSLTLLTHHAMTDGRHMLKLLAVLWEFYTEAADGHELQPHAHPIPRSLEELLAERGTEIPVNAEAAAAVAAAVEAAAAAGANPAEIPRFMAAGQAIDAAGNPVWRRVAFTAAETKALFTVALRGQTTVNGVVSAALMLSVAEDTGIGVEELAHLGAIDMRQRANPPIGPTECTNGVAAVVFTGGAPDADALSLARTINESLKNDLESGRLLEFIGVSPSLLLTFMTLAGKIVGSTNDGVIPAFAGPAGVKVTDYQSFTHFTSPQGPNNPTFIVTTFEGELHVDSTMEEKILDIFARRIREVAGVGVPQKFRDVLLPHLPFANPATLAATDDLAALGLDSMGIVKLLGDIQDQYDVELPDEILVESTFATVGSLWSALKAVTG